MFFSSFASLTRLSIISCKSRHLFWSMSTIMPCDILSESSTVFSFWPLRSFSSVDLIFRHVATAMMREIMITATVIILNFRLLNILLI
ncbi:hypothetical protein BMS3Abin09_00631 [bacterium BMS3Abin09]|nr:hypothetical protein BMS3Abin09_00631 [bacterium BMS3Abin09]